MANIERRETVGFIFLLVINVALGNICCVYNQFQAIIDLDSADAFMDVKLGASYSYTNATVRVSYDYTHQRIYMNLSTVELSPEIPYPFRYNYQIIDDYAKGIQYVFNRAVCQKFPIGSFTLHCIPDNAMLLSSGYIGDKQAFVKTYQYSVPGSQTKYTVTVNSSNCVPAYLSFSTSDAQPDSGTLNNYLISNVTQGISNPSVFTPPVICNSNDDQIKLPGEFHHKLTKLFR